MNHFLYQSNSLDEFLTIEMFRNDNLHPNLIPLVDEAVKNIHGKEKRAYTSGGYIKDHLNVVQEFIERCLNSQYGLYGGRLGRAHDYDENALKNMLEQGNKDYHHHSEVLSKCNDIISLSFVQSVRLMNKKEKILPYLIQKEVIDASVDPEGKISEDVYDEYVLALRGNHGFPLILGSMPSVRYSSIFLVLTKMGDLYGNMDPNEIDLEYIKQQKGEENLEEEIQNFKRGRVRNAKRVERLFPKLLEFLIYHPDSDEVLNYDGLERQYVKAINFSDEILQSNSIS